MLNKKPINYAHTLNTSQHKMILGIYSLVFIFLAAISYI